jgi:acetyltransferase-like isoleucine patch superfamily enzyme
MARFCWGDARHYVIRLYVRASWEIQGLSMASSAQLYYEDRNQIELTGKSSVGNYSVIMAGAPQEFIPPPLLVVGNNVYIGDQVNLRAVGGVIKIGNDVLIANQVTIVASNHGTQLGKPMILQPWRRGDVLIEDDVWVGAGVVILPGATIRRGAVIAAGAVVRGEVPSNSIYGGIPAQQIGLRS